ncbi:hypothetical protein DAMDJJ_18375 [Cupriavidus necator]|uniref:hypothetical protein n=1 Tax=Cupriavidus necator TaxID=106590 RepID=UPI003F73192B
MYQRNLTPEVRALLGEIARLQRGATHSRQSCFVAWSMPGPATPSIAELRPMLLCERKSIPRGPGWRFEIKYEGYRLLATTGDAPRLKSRNGTDATTWFPDLVQVLATLPRGYILDGAVCVLDDIGKSGRCTSAPCARDGKTGRTR